MSNPELEAPGQPPERPEWLEGNFTSVEAQAQAYSNARREMQQQQQRAQELEAYAVQLEERQQELEALAEQSQQPQYDPNAHNPLVAEYERALEAGDANRLMQLNVFTASQLAEQKVAEAMKNLPQPETGPDQASTEMYALVADRTAQERYDNQYGQGAWDEIKKDAAELLMANPDLIPETLSPTQAAERLVFAAEHVQGRRMLTGTEQDRNQQAIARQRRLMAQTASGSGTPPPATETDQDRWERLKNAPVNSYSELRGGQ